MIKKIISGTMVALTVAAAAQSCDIHTDNYMPDPYLEPEPVDLIDDTVVEDGEVVNENWVDAYKHLLTDKSKLKKWIECGHSYSGMAYEPVFIAGFSLADLDGDDNPELMVLALPGYAVSTDEIIIVYSYDEKKGKAEYITEVVSLGYEKGDFDDKYMMLAQSTDFFTDVVNNYNCIAGIDNDGKLVVFDHSYYDEEEHFAVSTVEIDKAGEDIYKTVYSATIENNIMTETGDCTEAQRVICENKPIMFYSFSEENIEQYISMEAAQNGIESYSSKAVLESNKEHYDNFLHVVRTNIEEEGYISSAVAYNTEALIQWFVTMDKYFTEMVSFTMESNEFTDILETDDYVISLVLDLDKDGINEAVVCTVDATGPITELQEYVKVLEGMPENQNYYKVGQAYFITEDKTVEAIDIIEGECLMQKQCLVEEYDCSYLCLNGYFDGLNYGRIITAENDDPVNITKDLLLEGHKYFYDENGIVWYKSFMGNYINYIVHESYNDTLANGGGRGACCIPYFYKFDGAALELYGARELTLDEVLEMGAFDNSRNEDATDVEFILFDNEILYVNRVIGNLSAADFDCYIYTLRNGEWELEEIRLGFAVENPLEPSTWSYMNKIHY